MSVFMNVTCPTCGGKCRVLESDLGKQVKCPACENLFQCGSASPPSLGTHPVAAEKPAAVQVVPQSREAETQSGASVRFRCPRCTKSLESPVHLAGQKVNCPDCGQRLQIPRTADPQPAASVNKTLLAVEEPSATAAPPRPANVAQAAPPPAAKEEEILTVIAVPEAQAPAPARREFCLECGVDVSRRPRIQTCPDCGSLFCSARCFRDHRHHAHPSRR
jgi:DNA-directed RNA polymerase subunit RPC12/RpoP